MKKFKVKGKHLKYYRQHIIWELGQLIKIISARLESGDLAEENQLQTIKYYQEQCKKLEVE